ncbi:TIR domain-containing protein [Solirubrobacter soli]|uniref:TIR domain-containing protein n=1 Tax=Solirubrobacter soli TaxID=363832 RepID=UPI00047F6387|nr:TIR domain-containing protein [Solirubrobacter soli]
MPRIAAYLTHSYRAADRTVNEFFWDLLWQSGFTCTVDPKSGVLSAPHLEFLVKRSACLIGIITHRALQPYYGCSPFALYEYGLAVLAQKPHLVFVESGVSGRYFPHSATVCDFDRDLLEDDRLRFRAALKDLKAATPPNPPRRSRLRGRIGLIFDPLTESGSCFRAIREQILERGYTPVEVSWRDSSNLDLCLVLDTFDLVAIDVTPGGLPAWLYSFVHGRAVPSLRLLHLSAEIDREALGPLVSGQLLRGVSVVDDPVVIWQDLDEAREKVRRQLLPLWSSRKQFSTLSDGLKYFRGQGRKGRKVFVSNFNDANSLAERLSARLNEEDIEHFHYRFNNAAIPLGANWKQMLDQLVHESDLFVVLVTRGYHDSPYAQKEFLEATKAAKAGSLRVVPYLLDKSVGAEVEEQGKDLSDLDDEARVETIVRDVDDLLVRERVAQPVTMDQSRSVDVAFVTILPEEYAAVLAHVDRHEEARPTRSSPNQHAWQLAELDTLSYDRPYRAVVALAGDPGNNNAVLVVKNTIKRFRPRYVLLVGIAGGLLPFGVSALPEGDPPDLIAPGDLVISSEIYGYEYGKIDEGFSPRHNFTTQADPSVVTAARVFDFKSPDWHTSIRAKPYTEGWTPRVKVGTIASGDKVVDNPMNEFFASVHRSWPKLIAVEMESAGAGLAVRDAVAGGRAVGFAMIRGISDVPRPPAPNAEARGPISQQTRERDTWKAYAADAAATFATAMVRSSWPVPPRG